jgi:hypothetical protein
VVVVLAVGLPIITPLRRITQIISLSQGNKGREEKKKATAAMRRTDDWRAWLPFDQGWYDAQPLTIELVAKTGPIVDLRFGYRLEGTG